MGSRKDRDIELEEDEAILEDDEILDDFDDQIEVEISSGRFAGLAGFAIGLTVGALLGAGAAMLTTPVRGGTARRRLRHGVEDLSDELRDRASRLRDETGRRMDRTRRRLRKARRSR